MQQLLGMCVENTNEMSNTINTSFNVQDVLQNIQAMMVEETKRSQGNETEKIIEELFSTLTKIKGEQQKLIEGRKTII